MRHFLFVFFFCVMPFAQAQNQCDAEQIALQELGVEVAEIESQLEDNRREIDEQRSVVAQVCPAPNPNSGTGNWIQALSPFIPENPREIRIIPDTSIAPVLLPDDGTAACDYLKCNRSHVGLIDWTGMGVDYENGIARFVSMGGHADLGANSVYEFDIGTLTWSRVHDYNQPVAPFPDLVDSDGDGKKECVPLEDGPMGTHSYDGVEYISSRNMTILMRSGGYQPKYQNCSGGLGQARMWGWHDEGYWIDLGIPEVTFPKSVYDPVRDKIYFASQKGGENQDDGFFEMDPHTLEVRLIQRMWNGKGGAMAMDENRDIWVSTRGAGLRKTHVDTAGSFQPLTEVVSAEKWDDHGAGVAASNGIVVGWRGDNKMYHYDSQADTFESFIAEGDQLPSTEGTKRVYGKFIAVPGMAGIFIGISETYGWIIYRAF